MPSERVSRTLQRTVKIRAQDCCEYCQSQGAYTPDPLTIDHIQPRHLGGPSVLENLAWACAGCNCHKSGRVAALDPQSNTEVALFNPRQQKWSDHFEWNDNFTQIVGKTPCGRATLMVLQLNRLSLLNLRRILVQAGLHPPKFEWLE